MNNLLDKIIIDIIQKDNRFGMDIDDVILNFEPYFRNGLNDYYETDLKKGDIVLYDVTKILPIKEKTGDIKELYKALKRMGNKIEFTQIPINEGVDDSLRLLLGKKFFNDGNDKFLINTSRSNELYDDAEIKTYENLRFNGFSYDNNIIFDPDKHYVAKAFGAKIFFEDSPTAALRMIEHNIPVVMPAQSWNIKTPRDIIFLDKKDAENKHKLINRLNNYEGTMLFRIRDFVEFGEYLKNVIKTYRLTS